MTIAGVGLALIAALLSGYVLAPKESPIAGNRVESDSDTEATTIARCIAYNVNKKRPDLHVRNHAADNAAGSVLLILTSVEPSPKTFGVIQVDQSEAGSHLTTWLSGRNASAEPEEVARRLIAGC